MLEMITHSGSYSNHLDRYTEKKRFFTTLKVKNTFYRLFWNKAILKSEVS